MKIVTISDTHNKHNKLDLSNYYDCDTIIHAGDWTGNTDRTTNFLDWYNKLPFKNKILIAGNHEKRIEHKPEAFTKILLDYPTVKYLNNTSITIDDINFFGSPWSNNFYNWAFMAEEDKLELIWEQIPNDTHVLITHGPAYSINDLVVRPFDRDPNVGSKTLQNRKLELRNLKVHISGHIHEAYGQVESNGILNICPSVLNEYYQLVNKPITFTI